MAEMKIIHDFAVKYHSLYVDPQTTELDVEKGFAKQCFALGFKMDCGNSFIDAFSADAFNKVEELDKVIDEIDDVQLLGSAIFSHWRYVTHWDDYSHLLNNEHRLWFIAAFGRLAVLTEEDDSTFIFEGTLKKIRLVSKNIRFGHCPKPEDEVEQHLTITADGRVWLSRYRYGVFGSKHKLIEKLSFSVSPKAVEKIMGAVADYFGNEYSMEIVSDVGSWNLVLTNTEGKIFNITGPLYHDLQTAAGGLSDIIRTNLNRNDLFAFDGNPRMNIQ